MELRIKNFDILDVRWKIWHLGGGSRKIDKEGGIV